MNRILFEENDLPLKDLETIGLASGGQLLLNVDDLKALLSGRRTSLMQLHDLEAENIKIKSLDAKVSLKKGPEGKLELLIHPIYRKPATPDFLEDFEARQLEKGEVPSLLKTTKADNGSVREMLVEYDKETREFIVSDTEMIMAPDMVNNEFLTAAQKEKYKKGKEVQLADGTKFNYSATDLHGIRSNKIALIASLLVDGGLSYVVYKGLNAMFNQKRDEKEANKLSKGYQNALRDLEEQQNPPISPATEEGTRRPKR